VENDVASTICQAQPGVPAAGEGTVLRGAALELTPSGAVARTRLAPNGLGVMPGLAAPAGEPML
jgi:hypothetical protein